MSRNYFSTSTVRRYASLAEVRDARIWHDVTTRKKLGTVEIKPCLSFRFDLGQNSNELIEVTLRAEDFDEIARLMCIADRETALSSFAAAILATELPKA